MSDALRGETLIDRARAHVAAVTRFDSVLSATGSPYAVVNLGTGDGVTVKELVASFERVWGSKINKSDAAPRPGDVAGAYANAERAAELLEWQAERSIDEGIESALEWGRRREGLLGYP